jgi:hypothetical protein
MEETIASPLCRRSLAGLLATTVATLLGLWLASSAAAVCAHFHGDPGPRYSGPMLVGIACNYRDGDGPDEQWTVPDTVAVAEFRLFGADDPAKGAGGDVKATLAVTPGETLLLRLGSDGGASSVLRGATPLLVAGGGDGAEDNYVAPGATGVESERPGEPNPPFPGDGSIYVSWYEGWVNAPPLGDEPSDPPLGTQPHDPPSSVRCVVPKLRGMRPAATRRAIAAAHCAAGEYPRVATRRATRGRVVSQAPQPGSVLPQGSSVTAAVGRGR